MGNAASRRRRASHRLLARDPASRADFGDSLGIARLLMALRDFGAGEQVATLLARDPDSRANLDRPDDVARLLETLRGVRAEEQAMTLIDRLRREGLLIFSASKLDMPCDTDLAVSRTEAGLHRGTGTIWTNRDLTTVQTATRIRCRNFPARRGLISESSVR